MKTFILSLLSLFIFSSCGTDSATINWVHDYNEALQMAKAQNKNVYLFIGADKCHFCKRFKERTLSKKHVMDKLNEDYITVYLSRDQHFIPEGFEKFGVPRHYFLDKNGKRLFESFGVLEPEGFFLLLDEAELSAD